jgi:preprotein translocase subunit SecE
MAKTRAQRKAEQRARLAREQQSGQSRDDEVRAQRATQVPESGEVAEAKAVERTGANLDELEAPAPSRADTPPAAAPQKPSRREQAEEKRRQKAAERQRAVRQKEKERPPAAQERRRGGVLAFFASCWAELKRVQWPNRETLVQASAVTLIFVAVAAAYLGALDAMFSFLIKRVL